MLLEKIQGPNDLKKMSISEINLLVTEARNTLIQKVSQHGGHSGPNLGVVELTVALHYVFKSPIDKIIFDVSHQTYIHKMLTGRAEAFLDKNHYDDVSGYTNPKESEHDLFTIGHTSTSLSLANGVAKARDLQNKTGNVIAVIGDGSLSGGLAFEGLNNIIEQNTNTIVIVNDNDQSIAENHGGIYNNLKELRTSKGNATNNIFKALGYEYHYLEHGNDVTELINLLETVKDRPHPILLHIHTIKGCGLEFAEQNREKFHAGGPFSIETGEYLASETDIVTYNSLTTNFLLDKMQADPNIVVINAGTPMVVFNAEQRNLLGKQFVDVGIAEEHAATMTAGLSKNGAKPIWAVFSTFMQRSFDQISHDLALNNLPGTILVYGASAKAFNDESHLGIFDIPFLSHIPNLVYLAPTTQEEYLAMLDWSIEQNEHPVAIRVPVGSVKIAGAPDTTNYANLNKSKVVERGSEVAILGLGNFFELAQQVTETLKLKYDINATLINPKFITGLDEALLDELTHDHQLVVTLEDGILSGGYGQAVASYLGTTNLKVQNYGLKKQFFDRYIADDLLSKHGIETNNIVMNIVKQLNI